MIVMSYDQMQLLETILNAGGVLEYSHLTMNFNIDGIEVYDFNAIHGFMARTQASDDVISYQIKPEVIATINERRRAFSGK